MILIGILLICACIHDAKSYRIPNQLIGLGYVSGFFLNLVSYGSSGINLFLINAIIPIALLFVLFIIGGLGAGDIKLFSVMATVVGVKWTYKTFIASVFLAGCVAIYICIKEQQISKRKLHYSYYIGAGFLLVWLLEELIK